MSKSHKNEVHIRFLEFFLMIFKEEYSLEEITKNYENLK